MEPTRSRSCGTTTTLFDLVAAVQESLPAEEAADGLAVAVVQDLLRRMGRWTTADEDEVRVSPHILSAHDAAA